MTTEEYIEDLTTEDIMSVKYYGMRRGYLIGCYNKELIIVLRGDRIIFSLISEYKIDIGKKISPMNGLTFYFNDFFIDKIPFNMYEIYHEILDKYPVEEKRGWNSEFYSKGVEDELTIFEREMSLELMFGDDDFLNI